MNETSDLLRDRLALDGWLMVFSTVAVENKREEARNDTDRSTITPVFGLAASIKDL